MKHVELPSTAGQDTGKLGLLEVSDVASEQRATSVTDLVNCGRLATHLGRTSPPNRHQMLIATLLNQAAAQLKVVYSAG